MRIALGLLVAILLISPAAAHGSPEVLDVERLLVGDEASDVTYAYDGYDIQTLHVRDVHWRPLEGDGLVFRIIASGGAVAPMAGTSTLELDVAGTTYTFATDDDMTWTGDLAILEQSSTLGDFGETLANLQIYLPLSMANATHGDVVAGIQVRSYADGALVDAAPGGYYGPGGVALPNGGAGAPVETEARSASGYTLSNITADGIVVANKITVAGQHVSVMLGEAPGWDVSLVDQATADVAASATHTWALNIASTGAGVLPVTIYTDLGGMEVGGLMATPAGLAWTSELASVAEPEAVDGEDAPGLPLALLVVALAFMARRRD